VINLFISLTEKVMVVSLSSLQNDSVPDKVEVTKFNLPADILLLLDLAHGPESDAGHNLWVKMQNYAKNRGAVWYSFYFIFEHVNLVLCLIFTLLLIIVKVTLDPKLLPVL